jgi:trans-aconitate 2-methyltransferase
MSRRWDAATYDRVADPMTRWGSDVVSRLSLRGDETVLDAGCGTGRVTEQLLERLPTGRVVALDASEAMLDLARARLARFGDRVTFAHHDLGRPLRLPRPVDAIVSTATFHWVRDQDALYASLATALRPRGSLAAQCGGTGNCASVFAAMEALGERPYERLRFSSPEEAREHLVAAGFRDV